MGAELKYLALLARLCYYLIPHPVVTLSHLGVAMFTFFTFIDLVGDVSLSPNPSLLPGGSALQSVTNGLGGWALIITLAGLLIGAATWALGSHSQNYQQAMSGRKAVLISGAAALIVGAAPSLINFFFHLGQSVH